MKRRTKKEVREIQEKLRTFGITINVYYNWCYGRTQIPEHLIPFFPELQNNENRK